MTEEEILSKTINKLERIEQAQWARIKKLENENARLRCELNAHPCLTNRQKGGE